MLGLIDIRHLANVQSFWQALSGMLNFQVVDLSEELRIAELSEKFERDNERLIDYGYETESFMMNSYTNLLFTGINVIMMILALLFTKCVKRQQIDLCIQPERTMLFNFLEAIIKGKRRSLIKKAMLKVIEVFLVSSLIRTAMETALDL